MLKVLLTCMFAVAGALLGTTFASGTALKPIIDDAGFQYYGAKTAYLTVSVEDGEVIVHIRDDSANGALKLSFGKIPALGQDRELELYGASPPRSWMGQKEARSDEQARLRKLVGMGALRSGWRVVHDSTTMDDAVSAYGSWFGNSGVELVADAAHSTANVRAFTASGQGDPLRVVFHRSGDGVRVYIGPT